MAPCAALAAQDHVLVVRSRDPAASEIADALVRTLAPRGVEARRPAVLPRPEPDESVERAREAYYALRPDEARALLEAWLVRADQSADSSREALIEGLVWLALARLADGDADGADAALDRALSVDPALSLDPARYPPTIRERLDACRASVSGVAPLAIEAEPPGARVFVDGASVGPAPVRIDAPVGVHQVRVSARGHRPEGRRVELGPEGATLSLRAPLDPARALREAGPPGSPVPRATRAAAQASGEQLLVLDVTRGAAGWRAVLFEPGSGRRASAGPAREPDALAAGLVEAWELPARTAAPGDQGTDPWPWIALGAGAAVLVGVVVGVVAALASQPSGFTAIGMRQ